MTLDQARTILGVDAHATPEQIKLAYRKLVQKWHPDRNQTQQATEHFKQIQAAYQLLQQPQPTHAHEGVAQHWFGDFGWAHQIRTRGVTISLEECWNGCVRQVSSHRVQLPPGVRHNTVIKLSPTDQLLVQIQPHAHYQRNQDDLLRSVEIGVAEAILGTQVMFMHLSGNRLEVKIPPGIQHGQVVRLKSQGLPNPQWPQQRGSLFCEVIVRIPNALTPSQQNAIMSLGYQPRIEIQ